MFLNIAIIGTIICNRTTSDVIPVFYSQLYYHSISILWITKSLVYSLESDAGVAGNMELTEDQFLNGIAAGLGR